MYPKLPFFFRWYIQRELPAWGRLYDALGMGGRDNVNPRWSHAPIVAARGKMHGYRMRLDLSRDLERQTYFTGRYYDLNLQLLLNMLLKAGDTFIDGGANVGMMTLLAASRVGKSGRVLSFDPIPDNCRRIEEAIADNQLTQVDVFCKALGEEAGVLPLHILGGDTIMATLRENQGDAVDERATIDVVIVRGDAELGAVRGSLVIKLDLEGWELFALKGLEESIRRYRPPIILEIEPRYLREAGLDETVLHDWMIAQGYRPYVVGVQHRRFGQPQLRLSPYAAAQELVDLNDFSNRRYDALRAALGNDSEYIDVLWLADERVDVTPYLVRL